MSPQKKQKNLSRKKKKDLCIQDLVTLLSKHFKKKWQSWKKPRNVGELQQEWQHFLQFLCHILKLVIELYQAKHFLEVVITLLLKFSQDLE